MIHLPESQNTSLLGVTLESEKIDKLLLEEMIKKNIKNLKANEVIAEEESYNGESISNDKSNPSLRLSKHSRSSASVGQKAQRQIKKSFKED